MVRVISGVSALRPRAHQMLYLLLDTLGKWIGNGIATESDGGRHEEIANHPTVDCHCLLLERLRRHQKVHT